MLKQTTYQLFKQFQIITDPWWADGVFWETVMKNGKPVKEKDKNKAEKLKKKYQDEDLQGYKYKIKKVADN